MCEIDMFYNLIWIIAKIKFTFNAFANTIYNLIDYIQKLEDIITTNVFRKLLVKFFFYHNQVEVLETEYVL